MKISTLLSQKKRISCWLWKTDTSQLSWSVQLLFGMLRIGSAVIRDLGDGQLSLRAMSLVYTTLISLVPLLALSFSVLKGFGAHNQIEPVLLNILEPLGDKRFDIVSNIIGFVDNIKVGVLGVVGLALLLYSVIAMMQKIEDSFNYTWQIHHGRSFSQSFSDYLSVILIGPLLIFLSVGLTATIKSHAVMEYIISLPFVGAFISLFGFLLPWLLMAFAFAFIYFYIPNTQVNISSAFIGGLVTAIVWKVMGLVFSVFVAGSSNQAAIYSAFASAIVFIVWLYLGWFMLLIGASIAFYHQNPENRLVRKDQLRLSPADEERLLLTISFLVAQRFGEGREGWSVNELARYLLLPSSIIKACFDQLTKINFLVQTQGQPERTQPKRPLSQLMVNDVMREIRNLKPVGSASLGKLVGVAAVNDYLEQREMLLSSHLGKISYAQLITQSKDRS
ncbi:MAG: YihY/virulence factor BrkB family protein [Endozoicomonas sp. (ex Botrylloides leachii)]|nr:YihY/virulence factor BrkB family protein [Endozoicomonas sp. (ex Botrylloides leachii)]